MKEFVFNSSVRKILIVRHTPEKCLKNEILSYIYKEKTSERLVFFICRKVLFD